MGDDRKCMKLNAGEHRAESKAHNVCPKFAQIVFQSQQQADDIYQFITDNCTGFESNDEYGNTEWLGKRILSTVFLISVTNLSYVAPRVYMMINTVWGRLVRLAYWPAGSVCESPKRAN